MKFGQLSVAGGTTTLHNYKGGSAGLSAGSVSVNDYDPASGTLSMSGGTLAVSGKFKPFALPLAITGGTVQFNSATEFQPTGTYNFNDVSLVGGTTKFDDKSNNVRVVIAGNLSIASGAKAQLPTTPAGGANTTDTLTLGVTPMAAGTYGGTGCGAGCTVNTTYFNGAGKITVVGSPAPFVTDVDTSAADGTYTIGRTIPILVTFSEPVWVIHPTTPRIHLATGGTGAYAVYASGNGTTQLTFNYVVGAGQYSNDLDYTGTDALELPDDGDYIQDADENDADLTLPTPGAAHSLGANAALVIVGAGHRVASPPTVSLTQPAGGETLNAGDFYQVVWSTGGEGIASSRLLLSTDGGATYPTVIASDLVSSIYGWTVPVVTTSQARVKVEAVLGDATVGASAESGNFTITAPEGAPTSLEGTVGEGETGTTGGTAQAYSGTISDNLGLTAATEPINCVPGDLMKSASASTVYYCGVDGKRYVFPNRDIYLSWYADFSGVKTVGEGFLAILPLGGNVTYKPGSLIKVVLDPKVYVVTEGGVRHWIVSEAVAAELFGADWASKVHDLPEAFLPDYPIGADINVAADYVL